MANNPEFEQKIRDKEAEIMYDSVWKILFSLKSLWALILSNTFLNLKLFSINLK